MILWVLDELPMPGAMGPGLPMDLSFLPGVLGQRQRWKRGAPWFFMDLSGFHGTVDPRIGPSPTLTEDSDHLSLRSPSGLDRLPL